MTPLPSDNAAVRAAVQGLQVPSRARLGRRLRRRLGHDRRSTQESHPRSAPPRDSSGARLRGRCFRFEGAHKLRQLPGRILRGRRRGPDATAPRPRPRRAAPGAAQDRPSHRKSLSESPTESLFRVIRAAVRVEAGRQAREVQLQFANQRVEVAEQDLQPLRQAHARTHARTHTHAHTHTHTRTHT